MDESISYSQVIEKKKTKNFFINFPLFRGLNCKNVAWEFPGGPVIKTLRFLCSKPEFVLWWRPRLNLKKKKDVPQFSFLLCPPPILLFTQIPILPLSFFIISPRSKCMCVKTSTMNCQHVSQNYLQLFSVPTGIKDMAYFYRHF